jgi:hypothetical protein
MKRLMVLMGVLVTLLNACAPPSPSLIEDEAAESEMRNDGVVR